MVEKRKARAALGQSDLGHGDHDEGAARWETLSARQDSPDVARKLAAQASDEIDLAVGLLKRAHAGADARTSLARPAALRVRLPPANA